MFYRLATDFLHLFPPETSHHIAINMLRILPVQNVVADIDVTAFSQQLMGLKFSHPLGLAAGFDKHAEVFDKLGQLGFSFVEVGSITPRSQPGNSRPRLFRLSEQQAIINRYGFNSKGIDYAVSKLKHYPCTCITGINLGKNKDTTQDSDDFLRGAEAFLEYADYFTINVSSPNTPGLRDLQKPEVLDPLINNIQALMQQKARVVPLLVKLSPDMTSMQETPLLEFLAEAKIDGIIISNTTVSREGIAGSQYATEQGGLSGLPLQAHATAMLRRAYAITRGKIVLIGCGGINSGLDAYEKLCAGANLLQLYTAFIFQGPLVIRKILLELNSLLARDDVKHIRDIIGSAVK